jgi:uncharacterized protein YhfF
MTTQSLPQVMFGDSPTMADELLSLVLSGRKTATCADLDSYQREDIPLPAPGHREIVLDGEKKPRCVLEYTEISVKTFKEVDERFARDEGEGDLSIEYWRKEHENFFRRGGVFKGGMFVVCKRFRVVETFGAQKVTP